MSATVILQSIQCANSAEKTGRLHLRKRFTYQTTVFGWKKKGKHAWYSDRKQSTIWEFDKPKKNADHPTMKPVPLIAYPVINSSMTGCIVLDTLGRPGSILIACEQTDRVCRTVELDEKYCDVIVKRYIAQPGNADGVFLIRDGHKQRLKDMEQIALTSS